MMGGVSARFILRYLKLFGDKNELGNLRRKTSAKISSLFKGKEEKILRTVRGEGGNFFSSYWSQETKLSLKLINLNYS